MLSASASASACGSSHGHTAGAGGAADTASAAPINCARSVDCPGALLCDRAVGHCVECLKSTDCKDGEACLAGSCHAACSSDKDCRSTNQLCGDADVCVDCVVDAHCARGETCSAAGTCEKPSASDGGAPSTGTGGTNNTAGKSSTDAGAGDMLGQGGTPGQGEAGMPSTTDAGAPSIGQGCVTAPIDPCVGIPHFTETQVVDGDPSDFCAIAPFELNLANATFFRLPKPPLSSTTKATIRAGWSASAFHIFIDVTDSTVHPNTSGYLLNIWNGDNIEFFASPKRPAGLFNALRTYESGAFQVIAAPPGALLPAGYAAFTSTGTATAVPTLQYKLTLTAKGYSFEGQIPWTDAAPVANTAMGFDAGLSDDIDGLYDATATYRDYYGFLYNAQYLGSTYCTQYYEPYCDSRNWCSPIALP